MKFLEKTRIPFDDQDKYFRAKERVAAERKFYSGLLRYVFFVGLLAAINYYTNQWAYMWFLWAAFGVGIGVVFKAIKHFSLNPFFGKDWEARKIKEFMEEDEGQNRWNQWKI